MWLVPSHVAAMLWNVSLQQHLAKFSLDRCSSDCVATLISGSVHSGGLDYLQKRCVCLVQEGEALNRSSKGGDCTEAQPEAQGHALRMLAAYLDATAYVKVAGEQQEVKAQLRGLRLETQVDLGTQDNEVCLLSCLHHIHSGHACNRGFSSKTSCLLLSGVVCREFGGVD